MIIFNKLLPNNRGLQDFSQRETHYCTEVTFSLMDTRNLGLCFSQFETHKEDPSSCQGFLISHARMANHTNRFFLLKTLSFQLHSDSIHQRSRQGTLNITRLLLKVWALPYSGRMRPRLIWHMVKVPSPAEGEEIGSGHISLSVRVCSSACLKPGFKERNPGSHEQMSPMYIDQPTFSFSKEKSFL